MAEWRSMTEQQTTTKYAVIIPAYNEQKTIKKVVEGVLTQLSQVIVVNDCSTDETAEIVKSLPVELISQPQNKGKAAALMTGIHYAVQQGVTHIITIDGDGQHNPADIPAMLEQSQKHPNKIVIAARLKNQQDAPRARFIANRVADFWISWAAGYRIADSQSGFRLYPAELFNQLQIRSGKDRSFVFESEILIKAAKQGYPGTAIAIESCYPEDRRPSHFRPVADITKIVLMVGAQLIGSAFNLPGLYRVISGPKDDSDAK